MSSLSFAEYVWLDVTGSCPQLRSLYRALSLPNQPQLEDFDRIYFDEVLAERAEARDFAYLLKPVKIYTGPLQTKATYIVLCEVHDTGGNAHISNYRARLRAALRSIDDLELRVSYEQRYTMVNDDSGKEHVDAECSHGDSRLGVQPRHVSGRDIAETHTQACLCAGVQLGAMYAGEKPGVWHYSIGFDHSSRQLGDPLSVCDDLWMSRYLLLRVSEQMHAQVAFNVVIEDNRRYPANLFMRFSTVYTRDLRCRRSAIQAIVDNLASCGSLAKSTLGSDCVLTRSFLQNKLDSDYVELAHLLTDNDPYRIAIDMIAALPGQHLPQATGAL